MMTTTLQTLDTPDGAFSLLEDEQGRVLASGWTADPQLLLGRLPQALGLRLAPTVRQGRTAAAEAVEAYYSGELTAVTAVPVLQEGTALQQVGWAALRRIVPGRPLTYTQFAAVIGAPAAVRAAAGICARNAPALFVPCHRVLRSDGDPGGFAWGTAVKQSLLARESSA